MPRIALAQSETRTNTEFLASAMLWITTKKDNFPSIARAGVQQIDAQLIYRKFMHNVYTTIPVYGLYLRKTEELLLIVAHHRAITLFLASHCAFTIRRTPPWENRLWTLKVERWKRCTVQNNSNTTDRNCGQTPKGAQIPSEKATAKIETPRVPMCRIKSKLEV